MKRAFITRALPEVALDIVRAVAEIDVWEGDNPPPRAELIARAADADGLLCLLTDRIDGEFLDAAPSVRVVSQMAVGYDNIDAAACKARGVAVGNTPGVLTETTAELAVALLLATARRLSESERDLRAGKWQTWRPLEWTGPDVFGSTVGIVGMGRIGFETAKRIKAFDARIVYSGRSRNAEAENTLGAEYLELNELLAQSDFVSLHVPLSGDTRHYIGRDQLRRMKSSAILINTARGAVVDTEALVEALTEGELAAAGLDVFETEPLPLTSPLLELPNVVLLPHIGSASVRTRTKMATLAAENLAAGLTGRPMLHPVV